MTLIKHEWKKLFMIPALWVFLVLCFLLNCILLFSYRYEAARFNQMSALAKELGQRVDIEFLEALENRKRTDLEDELLEATQKREHIFTGYKPTNYAEVYSIMLDGHTLLRQLFERHYELVQGRIAHLVDTDATLDFYAGPATSDTHMFLYGTYLKIIIIESIVLSVLCILELWSYEDIYQTAEIVCASKTGRRLYRKKMFAGVLNAWGIYSLLVAVSLGAYTLVWHYGGVWAANVSNGFHMSGNEYFITWADFTVARYLVAAVALGGIFVTIFALLAVACIAFIRNAFVAALLIVLFCLVGWNSVLLCQDFQMWEIFFLLLLQPVWVIRNMHTWFTDGSGITIVPWFESMGAGMSLVFTATIALLSMRRFEGKDVKD